MRNPATAIEPRPPAEQGNGHATSPATGGPSNSGMPAWRGCTGRLGYVAKMFPRLSETFILDEILALRRNGVPVKVYSLLPPVRDARVHPEAAGVASDVEVLSPQTRDRPLRALRELAACFRLRPLRTAIYVARVAVSGHPLRSMRRVREAARLACCLRRDRIAHVHAAWAHTPATVVRMACRIAGIPWSMSAHAKDIHLTDPRPLARKVQAARFTVACSAAHRELLASLEIPEADGVRRSKVTLVHHGVDTRYFAPALEHPTCGAAPEVPLILSVGRLVPKKGFPVLLEAASRLAARRVDFRLEIVGGGPEHKRLDALVASLGIGDRVVLSGMAVRDEVRAAYRRASCFVLACQIGEDGDRDGIPNTLAEAMACGLPVVATRLPGIEEVVRDGVTGILVPPQDPAALACALVQILDHPERARAIGAKAREWVAEHFDGRANGDRRARRLGRALGIERVLYVSADRGVPVRGHKGASVHVRSVVAALARAGVEARIVTALGGPGDGPAPDAPMIEARCGRAGRAVVRLMARLTGGGEDLQRALLRLLDNRWLYASARRLHATWVPDLVYERYALTAVAGSWLARHWRVPLILEVNAPLADEEQAFRGLRLRALTRWIEARLLRRADRVVVVSRALRDWVLRHGVSPERIIVLPNAADRSASGSADAARAIRDGAGLDGHFVVGFCGSLKPWHGVVRLLDAAALAAPAAPSLRLLIVGDGPERAALERRAVNLGIRDRVCFTGAVPHHRVPDHLAACDVLAAPYESMDGFYFSPLKLAEYLQTGRPVLASAVGEIPQLVDGAAHVTLLPPGDPESIAREIVRHARGGPVAPRTGGKLPTWTWDDVVDRILEAGERARRARWGWSEPTASGPAAAVPRATEAGEEVRA